MENETEFSKLVRTIVYDIFIHNAKVGGDQKDIEIINNQINNEVKTEIVHQSTKIELKNSYISDPHFTFIASKNGEVVRPETIIKFIPTGRENKWYHSDFSNDLNSELTTNDLSNWLIDKVLSI